MIDSSWELLGQVEACLCFLWAVARIGKTSVTGRVPLRLNITSPTSTHAKASFSRHSLHVSISWKSEKQRSRANQTNGSAVQQYAVTHITCAPAVRSSQSRSLRKPAAILFLDTHHILQHLFPKPRPQQHPMTCHTQDTNGIPERTRDCMVQFFFTIARQHIHGQNTPVSTAHTATDTIYPGTNGVRRVQATD